MNEKALRTLEFNKITNLLAEYAGSEGGAARCKQLEPMTKLPDIKNAQTETAAALARILRNGSLSFYGIHDIRAGLKRLDIQSALSAKELLSVASLLDNTKRIKGYASQDSGHVYSDVLSPLFEALDPVTSLAAHIKTCIISENEIADDASAALRQIRKSIKSSADKIHTQMTKFLNDSTVRTYLQDAVITQRDGRYCLPIKAEHQSNFPGMIHDRSGTGSTVFIEPMIIVKLNNDIKQLQMEEQEEIEKILQELSLEASGYVTEISADFKILTELDFIFSKAAFALSYNGTEPIFNNNGYIKLKAARHPLLDKHKVVPISLELGDKFHQLIVTGPNTGGKTVSLKTVGLLSLMGQAGLHIPARDKSSLAVFSEVYADIGDEQSIEQSLSTFSAHMTNIVSIIDKADSSSLVLFDELGSGTDPTEGAALATAILNFLGNMKVRTMATTHYAELKVYALGTEGVENACCEFDVDTLRPTYRLLIGVPGKSNAFAISGKLGLPEHIIDSARELLSSQSISFEDLLTDLEYKRRKIEEEELSISNRSAAIEAQLKKLEEKNERLDQQRERIIKEAKKEAYDILEKAKEYADESIKKFSKLGTADNKTMEAERTALREKMNQHSVNELVLKPKGSHTKASKEDFVAGARVKVLSFGMSGTIISPPNAKGDTTVVMGSLTTTVKQKDLEFISPPVSEAIPRTTSYPMSKAATISPEINLIGLNSSDALEKLGKYLDDAYLSHLTSVRIVHGKGSGILRNAVSAYLRKQPCVKSFRIGEFGEGDSGVTIASFVESNKS